MSFFISPWKVSFDTIFELLFDMLQLSRNFQIIHMKSYLNITMKLKNKLEL